MATVDIVIPTYRGIHPEANSNLHAMIREAHCFCGTHKPWDCNKGKHSIRLLPHTRGSSVVHWSRNQILAMALYGQLVSPDGRPDAEYLFLMDDDMLCQPKFLSRMLSYRKDFVTGIATIRRDPPRPNIRWWNEAEKCFSAFVEWDWDSNKLMEIDAVGAAFMLIRRRVFEKIGDAWLACRFERDEDKRRYPEISAKIDAHWDGIERQRRKRFKEAIAKDGDWKQADCWWFQFLDNIVDGQVGELGEDIAFCWKAKQLGFEIYADSQVLPGHIGDYGYNVGDYIDWWNAQKELGNTPDTVVVEGAKLKPHVVDSHAVSRPN